MIAGLVALVALTIHGGLYVALKVEGGLRDRALKVSRNLWPVLLLMTWVSLAATMVVRPSTLGNYTSHPVAYVIPVMVAASLAGMFVYCRRGQVKEAFVCSCAHLAFMMVGAAAGLYPRLLPSITDSSRDITIAKALSGNYALSVGLIWWTVGIVIAIRYFVFVYRMCGKGANCGRRSWARVRGQAFSKYFFVVEEWVPGGDSKFTHCG